MLERMVDLGPGEGSPAIPPAQPSSWRARERRRHRPVPLAAPRGRASPPAPRMGLAGRPPELSCGSSLLGERHQRLPHHLGQHRGRRSRRRFGPCWSERVRRRRAQPTRPSAERRRQEHRPGPFESSQEGRPTCDLGQASPGATGQRPRCVIGAGRCADEGGVPPYGRFGASERVARRRRRRWSRGRRRRSRKARAPENDRRDDARASAHLLEPPGFIRGEA